MIRKATECPHHSPEAIAGYIEGAAAIAGAADIPDDFRGIAFSKAIDLLAARHIEFERTGVGVPMMAVPRGNQH